MEKEKNKSYVEKFMTTAGVMAGASIALTGIIVLIAYEFFHANDMGGAREWIRIAHWSAASAIAFAFSSITGLIHGFPQLRIGKQRRILEWFTVSAFFLGWILMFIVLGKVYLETW